METSHNDQINTLEEMRRQLAEREEALNTMYSLLGKAYYEKHQNDPEDWALNDIEGVKKELLQLDAIKDKICEIKGIRLCLNCGQEVPLDAVFCSNCGCVLHAKNQDLTANSIICNQCGNVLRPGQKFCIRCGARVNQVQKSEPAKMRPQENMVPERIESPNILNKEKVPLQQQSVPMKNICPKCKLMFPDDMKFCTSCGSKLERS